MASEGRPQFQRIGGLGLEDLGEEEEQKRELFSGGMSEQKAKEEEGSGEGFQSHVMDLFANQKVGGGDFALEILSAEREKKEVGVEEGDMVRLGEYTVERGVVLQTLKSSIRALEDQLHRFVLCSLSICIVWTNAKKQISREAVEQHEQLLGRVHDLNDLRSIMHSLFGLLAVGGGWWWFCC